MDPSLSVVIAKFERLASPAEDLRQTDTTAVAWIYVGGRLLTGSGSRHLDIIMKHKKELSPADVAGLANAPLGRVSSDGSAMGLWFTLEQARTGPFLDALKAVESAGLASARTRLLFLKGEQSTMEEVLRPPLSAEWVRSNCRLG